MGFIHHRFAARHGLGNQRSISLGLIPAAPWAQAAPPFLLFTILNPPKKLHLQLLSFLGGAGRRGKQGW